MALLKKISGSSLIETMVATVLIVVVFMCCSLVLNGLLENRIKGNTENISTQLQLLEYQSRNGQLPLPHAEDFSGWSISVTEETHGQTSFTVIRAITKNGKKNLETYHLKDD